MRLNELSDNPGAAKRRMRVGRGPGSGKGKTGGRGMKGQTSRSGVAIKGFEGGQMPLHRRLPKRGFNNPFRKEFAVINLGTLQAAVEAGKIKAGETLDEATLEARGVVRRIKDGVRLLGEGALSTALTLSISGASQSAMKAVGAAGGSVTLTQPPLTPEEKAAKAEKRRERAKARK
ncbi:MAG: 50S ribosomal protein L15 [Pseudomonadota bacterium]